ncbi:unnamed protein product [Protopolystoma xenopodis]|uniref:Uncharacterized protein n=1 Tax=Protopolystoma xenopodis TaxID=117903 RepID=A0A448WG37_9PLAT|nr:unnamed protein product [Protopolystoma xenopodis]
MHNFTAEVWGADWGQDVRNGIRLRPNGDRSVSQFVRQWDWRCEKGHANSSQAGSCLPFHPPIIWLLGKFDIPLRPESLWPARLCDLPSRQSAPYGLRTSEAVGPLSVGRLVSVSPQCVRSNYKFMPRPNSGDGQEETFRMPQPSRRAQLDKHKGSVRVDCG